MKTLFFYRIVVVTSFIVLVSNSFSQIAMDFNTNDCNGNPVHLYSDLEAGKAVVLFYYMPNCGSCPPHATEIQSMANNINANFPGMVKAYSYPYQDITDCAYSASWVIDNNLPLYIPMNNGATSLAYYGAFAMPTIVLLGGANHDIMAVYDQGFDVSDTVAMRDLILNLLDPQSASITELNENISSLDIYPNPTSDIVNININLKNNSSVSFEIIDLSGKKMLFQKKMKMEKGEVKTEINTSEIPNGSYVLRVNINGIITSKNIIIKH